MAKLFDRQAGTDENPMKKATNLKLMYKNNLKSNFVEECIHFQDTAWLEQKIHQRNPYKEFFKFFGFHSLGDIYPHLDSVLKISLKVCTCHELCRGM